MLSGQLKYVVVCAAHDENDFYKGVTYVFQYHVTAYRCHI